jgi:predicted PurR-regulated permease PerM
METSQKPKNSEPVENETESAPVRRLKIEISAKSVFIVLGIIIGLSAAWELRLVFFMFFIAYILNAAFRPFVDKMEQWRIPRILSTVLIYLVVFSIIGLFLATIFSEAGKQLTNLISQLPNIVYNVLNNLPAQLQFLNPSQVEANLKDVVTSLLKIDINTFSSSLNSALGIFSAAASLSIGVGMIVVLSIYLLIRKEDVSKTVLGLISRNNRTKYSVLMGRIEKKLGSWLRAQILLMLIAASLVWLGLSVPALFVQNYTMHNYALPIAMLVFLVELVPGTGLGLGGILSTLIALATGNLFMVIYTPVLFIAIQQLEGMFIIPRIMNKAVGLDPVITILSVVAGYILFQVLGAILIVPILAVIQIVIESRSEAIKDSLLKS